MSKGGPDKGFTQQRDIRRKTYLQRLLRCCGHGAGQQQGREAGPAALCLIAAPVHMNASALAGAILPLTGADVVSVSRNSSPSSPQQHQGAPRRQDAEGCVSLHTGKPR